MNKCEAKRGFFSLYDCPKQGSETCPECQRHLCREHLCKETGNCHECEARKVQGNEADPMYHAYKMRDILHGQEGYRPFYFGVELSSYYDEYDARPFDIDLTQLEEMSDSPDEIFYDS